MLVLESKRQWEESIMYVKEAKWYQKQQKRKVTSRKIGIVLIVVSGLVLLPLCFCALQVWAMDIQKQYRWFPLNGCQIIEI